ncbi:hypothetical protein SAMN05444280_12080 [Tangfeifania diversioriginum]|uniref:Phage P1-related protein n=1 Tax=Tangfeifania diversioriginum TaxID=1168035 RepID=A0A1M6JME0_9BACT|nr:hypothetical protein [Tangfeifania diversioriginum]SHJ47875.1 hypothetical protein SAMN05444280_12080 [Tangfeifania diversioriginum]
MADYIELPEMILLEHFNGNYEQFIDAVYEVFDNDFIRHKTKFRGEVLRMKWHPVFKERAYTFYHMTHKGKDEQNREPDLRRCERIPWARPVIENCDSWKLKIWPQKRKRGNRLCIWLDLEDEPDYFVIIDVRKNYKLLWTAFVAEYKHEKRKKLKEYEAWLKTQKSPGRT